MNRVCSNGYVRNMVKKMEKITQSPKGNGDRKTTVYVGVRFPADVAEWLRSRASTERRSVSSLIVLLTEAARGHSP